MIPGFVRVSVKGQQCQRFVNLCRGREMDLKRIIRTGETELQLTMRVADFLQISPLRRKTGVHIHILKKKGPLFFLLFCKRRKMIPAGFLAVCCLLFFLSGRVWNVEIRGNKSHTPADELSERAGGLFRSIQKKDQLQCTCSFHAKRISGDHLGVCRIFGNGPAF